MKNITYCKTAANDGLLAHAYEHIVAHYVMSQMQTAGLYLVADYTFHAATYGTTCYLTIESLNSKVVDEAVRYIHQADVADFSHSTITRAIHECAIEARRVATGLNADACKASLQCMQRQSWQDIRSFTYEQADDATSINTLHRTPYVHYKQVDEHHFCEYAVEFSIDADHTPTTPLRALAATILQAAVLNFIVHMRDSYIYYDTGDQWSTASPTVGYRFFPRFYMDDKPDPRSVKQLFIVYQQSLLTGVFCQRFAKGIECYADALEFAPLGRATLNDILGGGVMGGEGWRSVADETTVRNLLAQVACDIYDEDNVLH